MANLREAVQFLNLDPKIKVLFHENIEEIEKALKSSQENEESKTDFPERFIPASEEELCEHQDAWEYIKHQALIMNLGTSDIIKVLIPLEIIPDLNKKQLLCDNSKEKTTSAFIEDALSQ